MEPNSPYAPPKAELAERQVKKVADEKDLEYYLRLLNASRFLYMFSVIWCLGAIYFAYQVKTTTSNNDLRLFNLVNFQFKLLSITLFLAAVGAVLRWNYIRVFCILTTFVGLILIPPIGFILSVFSALIMFKNKELFGSNRLKHQDIKARIKKIRSLLKTI